MDPNCLNSHDGIEDTTHFLLECSAFATHRTTLLDTVSRLLGFSVSCVCADALCTILLYGHRERDSAVNRDVLFATIKVIVDTERFSSICLSASLRSAKFLTWVLLTFI